MSGRRNVAEPGCFCSSDGELYAGVYVDFMGTDSAVFRTLGSKTAMRTDQYNSRWLNGNRRYVASLKPVASTQL